MSAGFRGASSSQDGRFSNKEKKLLKTMTFPEVLEKSVDFKKVSLESMKPWIEKRVTEDLGFEDDVVVNLVQNLLEEEEVNPKLVHIQLTPFLEAKTGAFMSELWTLLLSAQETGSGVPQAFLDAQAEERRRKRELERQMDQSFASRRSGNNQNHRNYRNREGGRSNGGRWDRDRRTTSRWEGSDNYRRGGHDRRRSRSPRRDYRRDRRRNRVDLSEDRRRDRDPPRGRREEDAGRGDGERERSPRGLSAPRD